MSERIYRYVDISEMSSRIAELQALNAQQAGRIVGLLGVIKEAARITDQLIGDLNDAEFSTWKQLKGLLSSSLPSANAKPDYTTKDPVWFNEHAPK